MISRFKIKTRANTKAELVTRGPTGRKVRRDIQKEEEDEENEQQVGKSNTNGPLQTQPPLDPDEILRRHFESQFAPLDEWSCAGEGDGGGYKGKIKIKRMAGSLDTDIDSGDISGDDDQKYDGFSDASEEDMVTAVHGGMVEDGPQVIDYTGTRFSASTVLTVKPTAAELKSFMSHKPPPLLPSTTSHLESFSSTTPSISSTKKKRKADSSDATSDAETAAANLKNDLVLQRLLQESHLLDPLNFTTGSSSSTFSLNPTGKNRHRAINSRTQALGGIDITKHKMPQPLKFKLSRAREEREKRREQRANDAGVILSKKSVSAKEKKKSETEVRKRRQDRGFGPSVGKFRRGALVLSKRDVREIEGPRPRLSAIKGGKRRR